MSLRGGNYGLSQGRRCIDDIGRGVDRSATCRVKDDIIVRVNQRAVDGPLAFTVESTFTHDGAIFGGVGVDIVPQGTYVEVIGDVENIGRTSQTYRADYQRLVDGVGRQFSPDIPAIKASLTPNGPGPLAINPGNRPIVSLIFDVPKNTQASQYVLVLHASENSPGAAIPLKGKRVR